MTAVGTVFECHPGSQALRFWIGFGAGRGRLSSHWQIVDAEGRILGACQIKGSVSFGLTGGSFDSVLEEAGEELADFLKGDN